MASKESVAETRRAQRTVELTRCMSEVQKVLDKYEATFNVLRVVQVGSDGIERSTFQVQTVGRPE